MTDVSKKKVAQIFLTFLLEVVKWPIAVRLYLGLHLLLVLGQDVLVRAQVVHHAYFAKIASGDKLYLAKFFLAVGASVSTGVAVRQRLEPGVPPKKRHGHTMEIHLCNISVPENLI